MKSDPVWLLAVLQALVSCYPSGAAESKIASDRSSRVRPQDVQETSALTDGGASETKDGAAKIAPVPCYDFDVLVSDYRPFVGRQSPGRLLTKNGPTDVGQWGWGKNSLFPELNGHDGHCGGIENIPKARAEGAYVAKVFAFIHDGHWMTNHGLAAGTLVHGAKVYCSEVSTRDNSVEEAFLALLVGDQLEWIHSVPNTMDVFQIVDIDEDGDDELIVSFGRDRHLSEYGQMGIIGVGSAGWYELFRSQRTENIDCEKGNKKGSSIVLRMSRQCPGPRMITEELWEGPCRTRNWEWIGKKESHLKSSVQAPLKEKGTAE